MKASDNLYGIYAETIWKCIRKFIKWFKHLSDLSRSASSSWFSGLFCPWHQANVKIGSSSSSKKVKVDKMHHLWRQGQRNVAPPSSADTRVKQKKPTKTKNRQAGTNVKSCLKKCLTTVALPKAIKYVLLSISWCKSQKGVLVMLVPTNTCFPSGCSLSVY